MALCCQTTHGVYVVSLEEELALTGSELGSEEMIATLVSMLKKRTRLEKLVWERTGLHGA